jgi:hypothetical protein
MCFDPIKQGACALLLMATAACTPELNWRDTHAGAGVEASEVSLQFPCKPSRAQRKLVLGESAAPVSFTLTGCNAGEMSFALGGADMGDAQLVQPTLQWMARKLALNINTNATSQQPYTPKGTSANGAAIQSTLNGKLPDGAAVTERIAVFAQGTRVYQATVMAPVGKLKADAADQFFSSIALHTQ